MKIIDERLMAVLRQHPDGLRVRDMEVPGSYSYQQITGSLIRLEGNGRIVSDKELPRTYRPKEGTA